MNSNININQQNIKLNIFFNLSNKYIFVKLDSRENKKVISISTSSVLFKGISNRNCIITVKLLGLIFNKILFNKDLNSFNFNKMNINYNSKIKFFFNQINKKVIL